MKCITGIIILILISFLLYWTIEWIRLPGYLESISKQLKRIADNLENKS